ncbi:MAG: hypothetical protein Q8L66_09695 [Caulobacter sp.]|nr:hypothetical protein [Caulobacter sp.]
MTDQPRRPILKLKFPPAAPSTPSTATPSRPAPAGTRIWTRPTPAVAPPPPPQELSGPRWKCKPCGSGVFLTGMEAETEVIRCPACNAKLGLAGHFLSDPPELARLRARL